MSQLSLFPKEELEQSPSYPPDFPVNLTALQAKVKAMVTSVTCGERLQDVSENLNLHDLSAKIHPVYCNERMDGISSEYSMTLPEWGIWCHGECGELATLERIIDDYEYLLLPTPQASDGANWTKVAKKDVQGCLYKCIKSGRHQIHLSELLMFQDYDMHHVAEFYEMMMGFPNTWTDLNA